MSNTSCWSWPRLPLHLRKAEVAEAGEAAAQLQWDIQEGSDQIPVQLPGRKVR
jgi:hypothetical protein